MDSPSSRIRATYDGYAIIVEMSFLMKLFFYLGMLALWPWGKVSNQASRRSWGRRDILDTARMKAGLVDVGRIDHDGGERAGMVVASLLFFLQLSFEVG